MKDISFHITDIVQNSVRAQATRIRIAIEREGSILQMEVTDNGCGMDSETLKRAVDPFYTTRTTRRVGLGLPFLIQNAEQSGGSATIESEKGVGTKVTARFDMSNIDAPPLGDIASTLMLAITGNPQIETEVVLASDDERFDIATSEIREAVEGLPLSHPAVAVMVEEILVDNAFRTVGKSIRPIGLGVPKEVAEGKKGE